MSDPPRDLRQLQRWMQEVITSADGIEASLRSPAAQQWIPLSPSALEQILPRSRALGSLERLEVYHRAYGARLRECLRELFPVLARTLSADLFDQFALGYLQAHPPRSYTLARLADQFVDFLARTRPAGDAAGWADFLIDLARLEWAIDQVFDGPGVEGQSWLAADELGQVPPERWPDLRLVPVPCLRLLAFRYPVNGYYTAVRRGAEAPIPAVEPSFVALTRRDYVVRRLDLGLMEYQLLSALSRGQPLASALQSALRETHPSESVVGQVEAWFRRWSQEGLFWRLEQPGA